MKNGLEICKCGHSRNLHESESPAFLKKGFHKMAFGCTCKKFKPIEKDFCIGTTSNGEHDFCVYDEENSEAISEGSEIVLRCNNVPCKEKRTFKITLLSLKEVKDGTC